MANTFINRADPLIRRDSDKGYRIGWKLKYGFDRGHLDDELTYGEARKQAQALQAKEPEKVFWPEMIMDPDF